MGVAERRLREKEARKTTILHAAERVFFKSDPDSATMDEVADAAELSKGLLYHYFGSKDELVHAIAHKGLLIMQSMFREVLHSEGNGLSKARGMGEAYIRFAQQYPDFFRIFTWAETRGHNADTHGEHAEACHLVGDSCIGMVAEAVQVGIDDGSIRPELNPIETAITLWAQTHGVIEISERKEMRQRKMVDVDQLHRASLDLMQKGLQA